MGHANKGSSSQNNHWWHDGELLEVNNAIISVPDSYGFVYVKRGTVPAGVVTTIDTEWFFGRVIEFTLQDDSLSLIFSSSSGNIKANGPSQIVAARGTIRFRAVRTSTGNKIWLQVGLTAVAAE